MFWETDTLSCRVGSVCTQLNSSALRLPLGSYCVTTGFRSILIHVFTALFTSESPVSSTADRFHFPASALSLPDAGSSGGGGGGGGKMEIASGPGVLLLSLVGTLLLFRSWFVPLTATTEKKTQLHKDCPCLLAFKAVSPTSYIL